jgi:hypothetical protein
MSAIYDIGQTFVHNPMLRACSMIARLWIVKRSVFCFNNNLVRLMDTFRIVIPYAAFGSPQPTLQLVLSTTRAFLQLG